jgi:hypothetical protein
MYIYLGKVGIVIGEDIPICDTYILLLIFLVEAKLGVNAHHKLVFMIRGENFPRHIHAFVIQMCNMQNEVTKSMHKITLTLGLLEWMQHNDLNMLFVT